MIADQPARKRLLRDFDRTFFVEAGAGTGKTTVIVGRIVNLVAAGRVSMEDLAAITFTEAAAAELRDRVREGLERAAADRPDPAEQANCRRAVEAIDLAAIQTIHAFCGGLLRTHPLEAGLPPGFATLDELQRDLAFDERFRAWFWGAALEPPAREVLRRALLLGLTRAHLRDLAAALDGQHDLLGPATTWPTPPAEDALVVAHALASRLAALAELTTYANNGEADPLAQVVRRAQPGAERLAAAASEEQALMALRDLEDLKASVGNQRDWGRLDDGRNACAAIKAELAEIKAAIGATLESHRQAIFAGVLALLRDFVLDGVAARKREGAATFQDLLAWARDLLRDCSDVRRRAQRRYRRIFVDEFQDTDPLQAEIVFYLAAAADQPLPPDWRDVRLEPGKLFVVGDPKQSIYRFRRADIAVYDALLRRLADARERLVQNFRSVRPLIDWVNHHFAHQMAERAGIQPPYVPLEASWEAFEDGARCGVYRVGSDLGRANAATVARTEAEALAGVICSVVGRAPVSERLPGGGRRTRPARAGDICILLRSRTHLRTLERALEQATVPYRVESGRLMLQTQEVRDLLACLRAIDDPSDQVALVGALRSPAYACADPDLLRWVEGGGRLSHEAPGAGPAGPVGAALASLADFHRRRYLLSPPALIEAFIRDRLLMAAAFGEPRPREAWRRLRYVVARARELTAAGRHSLRAFLDWIDDLDRAEVRDAESAEAEPDEDAVRILTVHGSKGLEFPIVLLAGLGSTGGGGARAVEAIADRQQGALACKAGPSWRTADFEDARAREQEQAEAEAIRLLYVAATRARDHLILSLHRDARAAASPAALIEHRLAAFVGDCFEFVPDELSTVMDGESPEELVHHAATLLDSAADEQAWLAHRAELVACLAAPEVLELDGSAAQPESQELGADHPELPGQTDRNAEVRALIRRFPDGVFPSDADPSAVALARGIRSHPTYKEAVASASCRHAVPFLASVGGVLIDTTLDLVYQDALGSVLVLYDFSALPLTDGLAARSDLLARAFDAATRRPAARVEVIAVNGAVRLGRS